MCCLLKMLGCHGNPGISPSTSQFHSGGIRFLDVVDIKEQSQAGEILSWGGCMVGPTGCPPIAVSRARIRKDYPAHQPTNPVFYAQVYFSFGQVTLSQAQVRLGQVRLGQVHSGYFFPGNTMRLVRKQSNGQFENYGPSVFFVRFQSDYTHRELVCCCDWSVVVPGSLSLFASGLGFKEQVER